MGRCSSFPVAKPFWGCPVFDPGFQMSNLDPSAWRFGGVWVASRLVNVQETGCSPNPSQSRAGKVVFFGPPFWELVLQKAFKRAGVRKEVWFETNGKERTESYRKLPGKKNG